MASKNEFSTLNLWKRKSVLIAIHTRHDNSSIERFLNVDRSWVWRERKDFEESEGYYEAIAKRSTHRQQSHCVKTHEFVAKVQQRIDIDPGKSIRQLLVTYKGMSQ